MASEFRHAIVRPPGGSFASGLTTASLGAPDLARARAQHEAYCEALLTCGLALTWLPADDRYPDSTFVEDTAVLTPRAAILTRPGAASREGEVEAIRPALEAFFPRCLAIEAPGTVDGGDICEAGSHVFIGLSERTNAEGARQLASHLVGEGYTTSTVEVRGTPGILHLKSGIAALDDRTLVVIDEWARRPEFQGYELVTVSPRERYAANAVAVNDRVLVAAGRPAFERALRDRGLDPLPLEMSEFEKMDGGLSCLSLRF